MEVLKRADIFAIIMRIRTNFENAYTFKTEGEYSVLTDFWYESLKKYPREVIYKAADNAIRSSEFAPKIKNILDEAEKLVNAGKKTDEELWAELSDTFYEVNDASCDLRYGDECWQRGNAKLNAIWTRLSEEIKAYLVNISTLREIAAADKESRYYEKTRFLKSLPRIRETLESRRQAEQFLKLIGAEDVKRLRGGSNE